MKTSASIFSYELTIGLISGIAFSVFVYFMIKFLFRFKIYEPYRPEVSTEATETTFLLNPQSNSETNASCIGVGIIKPLLFSSLKKPSNIEPYSFKQTDNEPEIAKNLRLAIKAVINFNENGPELKAIKYQEPKQHNNFTNKNTENIKRNLHRHSSSLSSVQSVNMLNSKLQNNYTNKGHLIDCGDSLRIKKKIDVVISSPLIRANSEQNNTKNDQDTIPSRIPKLKHTNININRNVSDETINNKEDQTSTPKINNENLMYYQPDKTFFNNDKTYEFHIPSYGKLRFIEHCPIIFVLIRRLLNYDLSELNKALEKPFYRVLETAGKSNAFFFLLNHGKNLKFMLKTLRGNEPANLKSFLPDYLDHLKKHPTSLLPKYLGLFTIERLNQTFNDINSVATNSTSPKEELDMLNIDNKCSSFPIVGQKLVTTDDQLPTKFTVVLMCNVFSSDNNIDEKYDFKGANIGRRTINTPTLQQLKKDASIDINVSNLTLKEMDYQNRLFEGKSNLLHIGPTQKSNFLNQLEIDLALLRKHEFMDYSLLVGIHKDKNSIKQTPQSSIDNDTSFETSSNISTKPFFAKRNTNYSGTANSKKWFNTPNSLINLIKNTQPKDDSIDIESGLPSLDDTHKNNTYSYSQMKNMVVDWSNGVPSVVISNLNNSPTTNNRKEMYFFGLIDILQKYTLTKRIERGLRGANVNVARLLSNSIQSSPTEHSKNTTIQSKRIPQYKKSISNQSNSSSVSINNDKKEPDNISTQKTNNCPIITKSEISVEEPNRYAERLIQYISGIIV